MQYAYLQSRMGKTWAKLSNYVELVKNSEENRVQISAHPWIMLHHLC